MVKFAVASPSFKRLDDHQATDRLDTAILYLQFRVML